MAHKNSGAAQFRNFRKQGICRPSLDAVHSDDIPSPGSDKFKKGAYIPANSYSLISSNPEAVDMNAVDCFIQFSIRCGSSRDMNLMPTTSQSAR
jgi:hypothetical protein